MSIFFPDFFKIHNYDSKIRLGVDQDGGYVIGNVPSDIKYDCYISAGVSNEESFSRDFIHKYNLQKCDCYVFDGTIDGYPLEYTDQITFIQKNIGIINNDTTSDLSDLTEKYNSIFLKMDIEGWEYQWLNKMTESQLKKFTQIVIEFHGVLDNSFHSDHNNKIKSWIKLFKTHFIIHAHGNNWAFAKNGIPESLELTYLNKNLFNNNIPPVNTNPLPLIGLDFPNHPMRTEIDMNKYPFVYSQPYFTTEYRSMDWRNINNLGTNL